MMRNIFNGAVLIMIFWGICLGGPVPIQVQERLSFKNGSGHLHPGSSSMVRVRFFAVPQSFSLVPMHISFNGSDSPKPGVQSQRISMIRNGAEPATPLYYIPSQGFNIRFSQIQSFISKVLKFNSSSENRSESVGMSSRSADQVGRIYLDFEADLEEESCALLFVMKI